MPHAVHFEARLGSSFLAIPEAQRSGSSVYHTLGPGVWMLSLTASPGRTLRLNVPGESRIMQARTSWETHRPVIVPVPPGETEQISVQTGNTGVVTQEDVTGGLRAAVQIIPMPNYTP